MTIPCGTCGRADQWPRPELGCPCGTVLRVPVAGSGPATTGLAHADPAGPDPDPDPDGTGLDGADACTGLADEARASGAEDPDGSDGSDGPIQPGDPGSPHGEGSEGGQGSEGSGSGVPPEAAPGGAARGPGGKPRARPQRLPAAVSLPLPRSEPAPRPAFQPVTIRTARDAVTAAALYLRWLGYRDIRRADQRPPSGIGLAARGMVALVDPTVRPASLRDVECLWLTAMTESSGCVYFSLAGYEKDARARADSLGVPLFVLDLTGTPQPANSLADDLVATGA
ncbi:hypothetical protein ACFU96_41950 [Streptomyces sp. NPDC057620]|uniref:hypothetical protein n=1 Tax=Streptomyces sp. NPDC057620 TaxID=3346185 RepID=UPI0036C76300